MLRDEGRDGDTDLGITRIMVKIETIGTDKVTIKRSKGKREPAGNSHFLEGFKCDKDQEKRVLKQQSQVQLAR